MKNCDDFVAIPIIAIDLGARTSYAACFVNGSVQIFPNIDEKRYVPSIVTVKKGKRLVGLPALNTVPSNIIYDSCQTHLFTPSIPQQLWHANSTNQQYILKEGITEHIFRQQEVIAMVLDHLKTVMAEKQVGCAVERAVICVPSFADTLYRSTVVQAAQIAGFKEVCLLNQSTAAAMAFKMDYLGVASYSPNRKKPATDIKFAVINIGAKSTEASVFNMRAGGNHIQLLSTCGDAGLGGEDFTNCLVNIVLKNLHNRPHKDEDMLTKKKSIKIIRDACEKTKVDLSSFSETGIFIDIFGTEYNYDNFQRSNFEAACSSAFERVEGIILKALAPHSHDISSLLLVGGASRMPRIKQIAEKVIPPNCHIVTGIVAEEAVVTGAAVQASMLAGSLERDFVHDFAYISIFADLPGVRIKIIESCSPIPTIRNRLPNICTDERQTLELDLKSDNNVTLVKQILKPSSSAWINLDMNGILSINFNQVHSQNSFIVYPRLLFRESKDLHAAKEKIKQYRQGLSNIKQEGDSTARHKDSDPKKNLEIKKYPIFERFNQFKKKADIEAAVEQQTKKFEEEEEERRKKEANDNKQKTVQPKKPCNTSASRLLSDIEMSESKTVEELVCVQGRAQQTEIIIEDYDSDFTIINAEECCPSNVTQVSSKKRELEEVFKAFVKDVNEAIPLGHDLHKSKTLHSLYHLSFMRK